MNVSLSAAYKSLRPFTSDELNDFTIITGKNGSGKSQLLSRFNPTQYLHPLGNNDNSGNIRLMISGVFKGNGIQVEGIIKEDIVRITYDNWKGIVNNIIQRYMQLSVEKRKIAKMVRAAEIHVTSINGAQFDSRRNSLLFDDYEYKRMLNIVFSNVNGTPFDFNLGAGGSEVISNENKVLQAIFTYENNQIFEIADEIVKRTSKSFEDLSTNDFYSSPIQDIYIDNSSLFSSKIEYIFYNYAKRRHSNRQDFFYKTEEGEENNSISDDAFVKKFTPPWDTINLILEENNLDFYFKGIDKREFSIDTPIDFILIKKSTKELIHFADLSSGEKVIFGLIIVLFTSQYYSESLSFPGLLVLDEPDAHLHPEMSKLLLDVLKGTFVNKLGIKVIITTHSPSTIALADEDCIYQLTNGENTSLKKISKDAALKILTGFIPTLNIDYKNHRQVFVESPTDVLYYQSLYDRHNQIIAFTHQLYFISNAPGKSNCEQVYKIVEQIRASGNNTAYGIVDWDKKNQPANSVHVHGLDDRYSVENFILDPIYIACLLIDARDAHGIMSKIGVKSSDNQYLLGNEENARLQRIVEYYFAEFEKKFSSFKYNSRKIAVNYLNGRVVEMPEWYLLMQGHEIVSKVKQIFPALDQSKYRSEGALQKDLVVIMSKMYPFVPMTSIKVLQELGGVQ